MAQTYIGSTTFNINLHKYNDSVLTQVLNATTHRLSISKTINRNYRLFKHKSCTSLVALWWII